MPLSPGARIGHYEILALAGAGGMGEVYRARDTVLKRDVALKVLPSALSRDPDRLGRFQREAEILASLNHPGIAIIHGMAAEGELRAIVMEFVEGETLRGPLPLDTALNYARQIIDALEYAHDRGVIHRDLKPGNVKIAAEGQVKLLDFGLAKAIEDPSPAANAADSPTLTLGHTRAGAILGTAAYMSPEQAVGKPADRRSDIFSFGSVVYEMLAGERAFHGDSGPEILVAVASAEPDWGKLPAETPEWLRALLRRCLVKDRKQRLQAIGEARLVLENPGAADAGQKPGGSLKGRPYVAAWVSAAVALLVGAGAAWLLKPAPPPASRPVVHFTQAIPPSPVNQIGFSFSRDGSRLAYTGYAPGPLYLRAMDEPGTKPIPGTEGAFPPAFSPDGQWLAYMALAAGNQLELKKAPAGGGTALTLAPGVARASPYVSWGADDNILYLDGDRLMRVASSGGKPEALATADAKKSEFGYVMPQLLPGGKSILVSVNTSQGGRDFRIVAIDVQTRETKTLLEGAGVGQYLPSQPGADSGYIVYSRDGSLFAAPFDAAGLRAGPAVPMLNGVNDPGAGSFWNVSQGGTLAYVPGGGAQEGPASTLIWVDRQGKEQPASCPARSYMGGQRISPEGDRAALMVRREGRLSDIWVCDLTRGSLTRITSDGDNVIPVWTPDGKRLVYFSESVSAGGGRGSGKRNVRRYGTLYSAAADGTGMPVVIVPEGPAHVVNSIARDGTMIGGRDDEKSQNPVLWVMTPGSSADSKPRPFRDGNLQGTGVEISPDGRWVAHTLGGSGGSEVYVVPYAGPGERVTVSTGGGANARWSAKGRELFYRSGDKMMVVDVPPGPAFRPGRPRMLFERSGAAYDVAPDGRFLMIKPVTGNAPEQSAEMHIVVNWIEELRRRVPPLK